MSDGAFGYKDLLEPDDKEKLQTHVLNFPNDLVSRLLLNCCERIEGLEGKSARYDSVVHMHTPLG